MQVFGGIGSRLGHIARDSGPDRLDMIGEQPRNHDCAIPAVRFDLLRFKAR